MSPTITEFSRPIASLFLALLAWQIIAGFKGGWGTWGQIRAGGNEEGIGILYHGSVYGGLYLWWVMATIWQRHADQWTTPASHWVPIAVGIVVTAAMFVVWRKGGGKDVFQQTTAGIPLAFQLGTSLAIACAFFVFTKNVSSDFSLLVATLLFVYVFLSQHVVLEAFKHPCWRHAPDATALGTLAVTFAALAAGYTGQQHNWWGWW